MEALEQEILDSIDDGRVAHAYFVYRNRLGGISDLSLRWSEHRRAERITAALLRALTDREPTEAWPWHPAMGVAFGVVPIVMASPRRRWLARLHNDHAIVLDMLGRHGRASFHYRRALRLADASERLDVLCNYIDRGYLPYAERLSERARSWTVRYDDVAACA